MKSLFLALVLSVLACGCGLLPVDERASIGGGLVIRSGTSFGFCRGYCLTELQLDEEEIVYLRSSREPDRYPEQRRRAQMQKQQWRRLRQALDFERMVEMEDVYGCPDCADGGAEWVEVTSGARRKRITFEYGKAPEAIAPLVAEIRRLRQPFEEDAEAGR